MIGQPQCSIRHCAHFRLAPALIDVADTDLPVCQAYPDGIPDDIAWGASLHLEVRDDQEGDTVYEINPAIFGRDVDDADA